MVCAGKKHDEHFANIHRSLNIGFWYNVIHVIIFQKFQCPILASFDHWDASWPVDLMCVDLRILDNESNSLHALQVKTLGHQDRIKDCTATTFVLHIDIWLRWAIHMGPMASFRKGKPMWKKFIGENGTPF